MYSDSPGSVRSVSRNEAAVSPVMGSSKFPKGPSMYGMHELFEQSNFIFVSVWLGRSLNAPILSLVAQQDPVEHLRRRKPWNRAFNSIALKRYEPAVGKRVMQFVEALKNQKGVVDLTEWINYFTCAQCSI